jgi:acetyl-CoA carboxylase biotin carboxylase subunit
VFAKILIANRGEIALRVLRTAREMGIRTAAIYSEQDARSLHVKLADEAYYLGDGPSRETYLNIDKITDIASDNGCEAVHPGYGFLSENPKFVRALEKKGVVFVGPPAEAMEGMGNKIAAKRSVAKLGLPVTPGGIDPVTSVEEGMKLADSVGFPIIVKAAAGGGGMGMVVVEKREDLAKAIKAAQAVAGSAFGDDSVFIERFLTRPRHIEIQLLADKHGNYVHFGERECSIQRRYQKLVEEAPSPAITPEQRAAMGKVAIDSARSVGYTNAGTVEMIWSEGEFFFNEMNTRLQVEHPVTEMVYGIDLVREQLRVAAGEPLGYTQEDIKPKGWSIEVRINAEDPFKDFMPTPGAVKNYLPPSGFGVRVDSLLYPHFQVPSAYDSMVAKLIVWGRTRLEAIQRMRRALFEYEIEGLTTTIPFHRVVMQDEKFIEGDISTQFVKERKILDQLLEVRAIEEAEQRQRAAAIVAALEAQPGGATEYARRHSKLTAMPTAIQGDGAANPWALTGRREALRRWP